MPILRQREPFGRKLSRPAVLWMEGCLGGKGCRSWTVDSIGIEDIHSFYILNMYTL